MKEDITLPRFTKDAYEGTIVENSPAGQSVDLNIGLNDVHAMCELGKKSDDCYQDFWVEPFTCTVMTKVCKKNIKYHFHFD